jgi:predicted amidohydrolase
VFYFAGRKSFCYVRFMTSFTVAAIQMTSGDDIAANIAALEPLVVEAVGRGAKLVTTPENTFYMRREGTAAMQDVVMAEHPGIIWAKGAAKQHGIWLLIGSIRALPDHFLDPDDALDPSARKPYNRSVLIAPSGEVAATYDKIHLFDVTVPDGKKYQESSQALAGSGAVTVETPLVTLGLSICYDLRFPALYQRLSQEGATVLTVPSAFTRPTGQAHWHTLLKARAIENACYVIASAQCGTHPGGRETYGHSLIIDPWGEILAEASGDEPQVITAVIDPARVAAVRAQIPVITHRRSIE